MLVVIGAISLVCLVLGIYCFLLVKDRLLLRQALQEAEREIQVRDQLKNQENAVEDRMQNLFKALSSEIYQNQQKQFLDLAKNQFDQHHQAASQDLKVRQDTMEKTLTPLKESLQRMDMKMSELEKSRTRGEEAIHQQIRSLLEAQKDLRSETAQLVTALRAPQIRGMWGEVQLKRVVELAGMLEYCDFVKQESVSTEAGRLRPDLIVKLPGGKNIVVDAKTPLMAFLELGQQENPEARKRKLLEHATYVKRHIEQLGRKSYWDQFRPSPEFVVLFMPGESFFSAALEGDPSLIEAGVSQNVILATPTTLIALLRAVAFGWRQEKLADNARIVGELGKELYKRLSDLSSHFSRMGKNLETAVDAYNSVVGTYESRVMVSARRFRDLDSAGGAAEVHEVPRIERKLRELPPETP